MEKEKNPARNPIDRVAGKIEELKEYGGLGLFLEGCFRHFLYRLLRIKYNFHNWHLTPIEWRPYALEVVRYINELSEREKFSTAVEIGCGTGDVLARLKIRNRIGIDNERVIIKVAKLLYPGITFKEGSFNDVKGENIDVLITVGIIHDIDPKDLLVYYNLLLKNNKIRYICLDSVDYQYHFDFDRLFQDLILKVEKVYEKTGFKSGRKILVYKIINES